MAMDDIEKLACEWNLNDNPREPAADYYCATRDVFQARLDNMIQVFSANKILMDNDIYVVAAIIGEIGNNSFDHNIGNWPDVPGIFFGTQISDAVLKIIISDRGQGVLKSLRAIRADIIDEKDALKIAFFERISGRAPESRGNGLKFVRENIKKMESQLIFISGNSMARLNHDFKIDAADKKIHGCLAIISVKL